MKNLRYPLINNKIIVIVLIILAFCCQAFFAQKVYRNKRIHQNQKKSKQSYNEQFLLNKKLTEKKRQSWQVLKLRLRLLKQACQKLYDPNHSPFLKQIAISSDPESFIAKTTKSISGGDYKIKVIQIAQSDKITSLPINKDSFLEACVFSIQSGQKQVKIDFSQGGDLTDLIKALRKSANELLTINRFPIGDDNEVLVIEGVNKGEMNKLKFKGNLDTLKEIGLVESIGDNNQSKLRYNYITQAQDAKLLLNGKIISHDNNIITDLIKGTTIQLIWTSTKTEFLHISYDYDQIIEDTQRVIDEYNNIMLFLKNTMDQVSKKTWRQLKREEEFQANISFEEKELHRLSGLYYKGILAQDFTAKMLKTSLIGIMTKSPFSRYDKRRIRNIFQIGFIKPDRVNTKEEQEHYNTGYLFLNKKLYKSFLEKYFEDIKQLFIYKREENQIKNPGIVVQLVELIEKF